MASNGANAKNSSNAWLAAMRKKMTNKNKNRIKNNRPSARAAGQGRSRGPSQVSEVSQYNKFMAELHRKIGPRYVNGTTAPRTAPRRAPSPRRATRVNAVNREKFWEELQQKLRKRAAAN